MPQASTETLQAALEKEKCRRDAHTFIFGGHLKTKDEQDHVFPVKATPDMPYLRCLIDLFLVGSKFIQPTGASFALDAGFSLPFLEFLYESGLLFVEKSRDLFVTNIVCCFIHWRAKFNQYQLILIQSKNELDAANLVYNKEPDAARISFQEYHLPKHLKTCNLKQKGAYGTLLFPTGSKIHGIPEGGHVIRSEHPSMVFGDEAAFQEEFGNSFTAALPAIAGGGFGLYVSSAEPGEFEQMVHPDEDNEPTDIGGLTYRLVGGSIPVVRVHYSCHPERVPGTPQGDEWRRKASLTYADGGINSPRWKKEQEIDYGALGGTRLFPSWDEWRNNGCIVIPEFIATGYDLYGSYDHGWRNPSCYLVHGIDRDGEIITLWEFYADHVPSHQIARIIQGHTVTLGDGRRFAGNPYANKERFKIADPSLWAEDQPMMDEPNKSIADIFSRCGVYFIPGERGGDTTLAEWLHGHFWKDPRSPLYRITSNCVKLIWEIGKQRHKEYSSHVALTKDQPEALIDKDNHAWDALKYFIKRFPPPTAQAKPALPVNSFFWWQKLVKSGDQQKTFTVGKQREMIG